MKSLLVNAWSAAILGALLSAVHTYSVREFNNYLQTLNEESGSVAKRAESCPPWKPFPCPEGDCIPLNYVCDKNADCPTSEYDEDERMCTAKKRPPVDYTTDFLENLLQANGADFFVKFFGPSGANRLAGLGGTKEVAIAFTESPNVAYFAKLLKLPADGEALFRKVLKAIHENKGDALSEVQLKGTEAASFKMYADKLVETGFLKP